MNSNSNSRKKLPKNQGNSGIEMDESTKNKKYSEKLLPKRSITQKPRGSSASNAGILYYKCLTETLEKKINELQNGIEKTESTMKTQKENMIDMNNRKNKMLSEFHENFRKYTLKSEYENKMEVEIEQLVKFLDELMVLHDEICYVKTSENDIRNYAVAKYQAVCSDLQPIKESYEKNVEKMKLKLNELKEWKTQLETLNKLNSKIDHAIHLHQEKLNHLKWSIKNEIADGEILRSDGERIQVQTEANIFRTQQILKNDAIKIQQAFYSLKNQFIELKSNQIRLVEIEQKLANYNERFSKNSQKIQQIETDILEETTKFEELKKKYESDLIHLRDSADERKVQIKEQQKLKNILQEYKEKTYANEVKRNKILKKEIDDLSQENAIAKKILFELETEVEMKMEKINELKNDLLSKNILINDNTFDQNFFHSFLSIENEQNVACELIDTELNALFDKICEQRPYYLDLENRFEEVSTEGRIIEQEVTRKEQILKQTVASAKMYDADILALKQSVYQKKSVTMQDLTKQKATLSNHVEIERNTVEKLKMEIANLRKKRPLLTPEKKRRVVSGRTIRSEKNIVNSKIMSGKSDSSDSDVYCFK